MTKNYIKFIFWRLKTTLCQHFQVVEQMCACLLQLPVYSTFFQRMISEGSVVASSSLDASFADGWCAWSARCHKWDSLERCDAFFISEQILHPLKTCVMHLSLSQRPKKSLWIPNDGSHVESEKSMEYLNT